MSGFVCVSRARFAVRLALTGAAAGLLAGCSNSERLSDPWSNPFQSSANVASEAPAAVSPVQSRPLGAPTASANPAPPRGTQGAAGWSAQGGSPIVVAQGENAQILSNRYGVPLDALVRANGFASASQIVPGTRIVIPVYNAALAASSGARVAAHSAPGKPAAPAKVAGARPRTLASQAETLKYGETRTAATKAAAARKPTAAAAKQETAQAKMPGETKASTRDPASAPAAEPKKTAMASETANPEFRWPARGRIIQGFKPGGNDGINIAVPEGTSVKAAESGVVAYAGNELKGYGNLILIRHPNGFVSAYANNGDIEVKRGETVKRGQTIAKSGQSGNVASPQLHFELRKGTKPVDPTQYLAGV
ncbi:MAG: peptidoglycan DD-metalloendopeptidase family protein [Methylocella sp.]|nr:MAG: peptidase M23 [Hyphomicrobiales bacterium]